MWKELRMEKDRLAIWIEKSRYSWGRWMGNYLKKKKNELEVVFRIASEESTSWDSEKLEDGC